MMTVSEAERARRAAEKGRSASFCATGQLPLTLAAAHSSTDVCEGGQEFEFFMQAANGSAAQQSPRAKLKASQSARRSQSCRVQGSRPPRATRRHETPRGSAGGLDQSSETHVEYQENLPEVIESGSYNPFLKKVGSCGRLVTLAPDDEAEESPTLQRSASARRHRPTSSPTHSPTPTRVIRATGSSSSIKGRAPSRKGGTPNSGGNKRTVHTGGYLEVRTTGSSETLDPDACILRNFSTTTKGIVNRGDSFRRRRSRSNSIQPPYEAPSLPSVPPQVGDIPSAPASPELCDYNKKINTETSCREHFRIAVVGATGVGKTALMNQFRTSECINAYDCSTTADNQEETVSIVLNNIESEIVFVNITAPSDLQDEMQRAQPSSGWLVIYSVTDKASFQRAKEDMNKLQSANLLKGRVAILVGNKCELVRSRSVSFEDGRDMACNFSAKFMEISVGMNHKCDELLVGILHQLRLKEEAAASAEGAMGDKEKSTWTRNRSLMRASMKAKKLVNRIIGKSDSKHKECEDFLN